MNYLTFSSVEQFLHYKMTGRKPHPKSKFTPAEDETLKKLVAEYGENDWETVSKKMSFRNQRQCKERWFNYLSPNINSSPWTTEEDEKLEQLHQQLGSKWVQIAKFFPSRTDINIRSRWMVLQRHKKKNENLQKSNSFFTQSNQINNFQNPQSNSPLQGSLNITSSIAPLQNFDPSVTHNNNNKESKNTSDTSNQKNEQFNFDDLFSYDDPFTEIPFTPVEMSTNEFNIYDDWEI